MSAYIPEEMIIQIFSKLRPQILLRFICLSKSWKSVISSPEFIWLHTQQTILSKRSTSEFIRYFSVAQRKETYLIRLIDASTGVETELRLGSPFSGKVQFYYRVVGSCHGVFCLLDDLFGYENRLVLWNPIIRRCLTIPMPPLCNDNLGTFMFVFGFGFAIKTRDYKVVRMAYAHDNGGYLVPPKVEVYALSSGIWKEFDGFVPDIGVIEYFWTQAVVCGKVHWTAYKRTGERIKVENLIMVFDLNDEIFQELSLPDLLVNEPPTNLNAAEYRESLAVYQYDTRIRSSSCAIWVMKQYGVTESWSKEYNVALYPWGLGMVLGFSDNSEILLTATGVLASYNPETQEKLCLGVFGTRYSFYFGTYEESLVLLDKGAVLPPLDLSSSESDDDEDEDEDLEYDYNDPNLREYWMRHDMLESLTAFLGARNI